MTTSYVLISIAYAVTLSAAAIGVWGVCRLLARVTAEYYPAGQRHACFGQASAAELLRLESVVVTTEWLPCNSPACAHLSTPHRRSVAEYAVCDWCGQPAFVPAPTTPKEGTDA